MKNAKPHLIENLDLRKPVNKDSFAFRLDFAMKLRQRLSIDIISETGFSKSTISLYINGKSMPSKERLLILSKCLGVDAAWLLGLTPFEAYKIIDEKLDKDEKLIRIRNIYNCLDSEDRQWLSDTANLLFEARFTKP